MKQDLSSEHKRAAGLRSKTQEPHLNNTTFWHFLVETSEPRICHSLFELFLCHFHSPYDESFKNAALEMRPDVMAARSTLNMRQSARVQFQPNNGRL